MDDRLIHPMFPKSSRSAPHSGPSAAALAVLLAALLVLAVLLPSVGRVGVDSPRISQNSPACWVRSVRAGRDLRVDLHQRLRAMS